MCVCFEKWCACVRGHLLEARQVAWYSWAGKAVGDAARELLILGVLCLPPSPDHGKVGAAAATATAVGRPAAAAEGAEATAERAAEAPPAGLDREAG